MSRRRIAEQLRTYPKPRGSISGSRVKATFSGRKRLKRRGREDCEASFGIASSRSTMGSSRESQYGNSWTAADEPNCWHHCGEDQRKRLLAEFINSRDVYLCIRLVAAADTYQLAKNLPHQRPKEPCWMPP